MPNDPIVLRPRSEVDDQNNQFIIVGGGTAVNAIRDDSTSTYLETGAHNNGDFAFSFRPAAGQTVTAVPAHARVVSYVLRVQGKRVNEPNALYFRVGQDFGRLIKYDPQRILNMPTAITTKKYPGVRRTPHYHRLLTQTFVNNVVVRLSKASESVRIYGVYLDIYYDRRPTVTITAPTGTLTSTSTPTVLWDYDDDLETQRAFEVEVVDTSTGDVFYRSGDGTVEGATVYDGSPNFEIPRELPNGDYTIRVRVAQQWNINDGGEFWSAWDEESVTIDVVPPPSPTLSITEHETEGYVTLAADSRVNLMGFDHSTFEDGILGWTTTNATVASTGSPVLSGQKSAKLTITATGAVTFVHDVLIPALPLTAYEGMIYIRTETGDAVVNASVGLRYYNAAFSLLETDSTSTATVVGSWTKCSVTGSSPALTAYVALAITLPATNVTTDIHYFDQAGIFLGTGNSWSRGGFVTEYTNLLPYVDSTFEGAEETTWQNLDVAPYLNQSEALSTTQARHGTTSLRLSKTTSTGDLRVKYGDLFAATPAEVFAVNYAVYSGAARTVNMQVDFYDEDQVLISSDANSGTSTLSAWTYFEGTSTAPALTAYVGLTFIVTSALTSEIHYLDTVGLYRNALPPSISGDGWVHGYETVDGPYLVIEHSEDDGETWVTTTMLDIDADDSSTSFDDYEVRHDQARKWRAYNSRTADDHLTVSEASAEVEAEISLHHLWLHLEADPATTSYNFLYDGRGRSEDLDLMPSFSEFSGRTYAVAEYAEGKARSFSVKVSLPSEADRTAWRAIAEEKALVVFRDQRGRRAIGSITGAKIDDVVWGEEVSFDFALTGEQSWETD